MCKPAESLSAAGSFTLHLVGDECQLPEVPYLEPIPLGVSIRLDS